MNYLEEPCCYNCKHRIRYGSLIYVKCGLGIVDDGLPVKGVVEWEFLCGAFEKREWEAGWDEE